MREPNDQTPTPNDPTAPPRTVDSRATAAGPDDVAPRPETRSGEEAVPPAPAPDAEIRPDPDPDAPAAPEGADPLDVNPSTFPKFPEADSELSRSAAERQARRAQSDEPVSFGRQVLQLVFIPAVIVAGVMAVWMIVYALGTNQQDLDAVLDRLETASVSRDEASVVDVPASQERARAGINLLGIIESYDRGPDGRAIVPEQDAEALRTRLPKIAALHRGRDEHLGAFILGAIGVLGDPLAVPIFRSYLESEVTADLYAAVYGMALWSGPSSDLEPLQPLVVEAIRRPDGAVRAVGATVLASITEPDDMAARDALAAIVDDSGDQRFRDAAWTAGAALAALGDPRGLDVVASLLDREFLAAQPLNPDPTDPDERPDLTPMNPAGQSKVIRTILNVIVTRDPEAEAHVVRGDDPGIWALVEDLAANDPDPDVRHLAGRVLDVRDGTASTKRGEFGDDADL